MGTRFFIIKNGEGFYGELTCIARISAINKKSSSGAFKDAIVSDKIIFTCPLTKAGGNKRGSYAKYVNIFNERTGGESELSFNQLSRILDNFEFEQIQ